MAALLIVVNLFFIKSSAAFAAPVVGGEVAGFLAGALGAAGHSQSEIDGLSISDQLDLLGNDLKNGNLTLDTPITYDTNIDGINQSVSTSLGVHLGLSKDVPFYNPPVYALNWYAEAVKNFISDYNVLSNSDYFIQTPTTDMNGYGVKVVINSSSGLEIWYGDFLILYDNPDFFRPKMYGNLRIERYSYDRKTNTNVLVSVTERDGTANLGGTSLEEYIQNINSGYYEITGDVRAIADSPALPDYAVDYEYQLGEIDGIAITPDMLNPDGTVTIDGVTYDPADYLDPDSLTEEGKKQLIYNIANVITNTYVKSEDKPLVDEDDITVEVAEELENFTVPTGIITVFPFCLPFDFVRGMKTLVQKPKVPVFKAELDLTNFCGYDLGKHTIEISFEKWEPAAAVCRWFFILLYVYTLILLTGKIVKGAGA